MTGSNDGEKGRERVRVGNKEQLKEAINAEDDWTGKTSAKERRRLQNRLNQRAWRRRKAEQSIATASASTGAELPEWRATCPADDTLSSAFAAATASITTNHILLHHPDTPAPSRPALPASPRLRTLELDNDTGPHASSTTQTQPTPTDLHSLMHFNLSLSPFSTPTRTSANTPPPPHREIPLNLHTLMRFNLSSAPLPSSSIPTTSIPPDKPTQEKHVIPPLLHYYPHDGGSVTHLFRFPLAPDHYLITLIQYNVLRALITNFTLCGLLTYMPAECQVAMQMPLMHELPSTSEEDGGGTGAGEKRRKLPRTFDKTPLQLSVGVDNGDGKGYAFWIDSVPCPQLRNNIILASTSPSTPSNRSTSTPAFDEDALCDDTCGGLYSGFDDTAQRGLLVWGDPWVVSNWEISPGFAEKWGFLLQGCGEMVRASNRWREGRGEEALEVVV